jgi:acyl-CoA dehydrogenase family member 9
MIVSATAQSEVERRREKEVRQAEELLFSEPRHRSLGKELFWGRLAADLILPYPALSAEERPKVAAVLQELRAFCDAHLDPADIDRRADIPRAVIDGLAGLGVLGMTAPESVGGHGFSQLAYCQVLEEIGSRCSATSIFVNAHHSIGMRALLLFGTAEQKRQWLPDLVSGKKLAAFALTEPQAGSDAANVQTTATPSADGSFYVLNGGKRYITNAAIADVLTVMARTPVPGRDGAQVSAFLVTPDMPGFRIVKPRMEKLGIRGTATATLAFDAMAVPRENTLGTPGKGLKVALTVLDFGRTTFGACCTGLAKTCLRLAAQHARTRIQFGRPLAAFELVQEKLARMAAWTYAMQSMTTVTAGLIDRGLDDYMLETAMLKVWSTEALWTIVNDAFQIFGGAAYFTDQPLERILRDARINLIGEGANEVLTSFTALVGMRDVAEELRTVRDSLWHPWQQRAVLAHFAQGALARFARIPRIPVRSRELAPYAWTFSRLIHRFGMVVTGNLVRHREAILDRQLVQEPIAQAAMELFASLCVLSRRDAELAAAHAGNASSRTQRGANGATSATAASWEPAAATLFLDQSARRIREAFRRLHDHDNKAITRAAAEILRGDMLRSDLPQGSYSQARNQSS